MKHIVVRYLLTLVCVVIILGVCGMALAEGYIVAIPFQYDYADHFYEGLAEVRVGDWETGKHGFIDTAGTEVVPARYDYADRFHEGLAAVRIGGKYGFIDLAGTEVVPPRYDDAGYFVEGFSWVRIGDRDTGKYGFVDTAGTEVVPCKYDSAACFSEGLAAVRIGDWETGKYGFVNTEGKEVIPCIYDDIDSDSKGGFVTVALDEHGRTLWGFIDKSGRQVTPIEYDKVGVFSEGLAGVIKDGKLGFIDETGAVVIPFTYSYEHEMFMHAEWYDQDVIPVFSQGLAAIWGGNERGGQYGYIDQTGKVIIPFEYDYAAPFSQGLAYVSKGGTLTIHDRELWMDDEPWADWLVGENPNILGKFGYIDKTGKVVVPLEYDCDYSDCGGFIIEHYFSDGFARVSKTDPEGAMKYGMIDETGTIIAPIQYDWVWRTSDGQIIGGFGSVFLDEWVGCDILDETSKEIISVDDYDYVEFYSGGATKVYRNNPDGSGTFGFVDATGKEVVPCIFESAFAFSEGLAAVQVDGKWGYIAIAE